MWTACWVTWYQSKEIFGMKTKAGKKKKKKEKREERRRKGIKARLEHCEKQKRGDVLKAIYNRKIFFFFFFTAWTEWGGSCQRNCKSWWRWQKKEKDLKPLQNAKTRRTPWEQKFELLLCELHRTQVALSSSIHRSAQVLTMEAEQEKWINSPHCD